MKKTNYLLIVLLAITMGAQSVSAKVYEVPPSSTVRGSVPWISDEAMESCVKLYNEGKWLGEKINRMQVDQYSQSSVSAYNNKVSKHSKLTNQFNQNCAGKQSESAYKAAQKLNQKGK